MNSFIDSNSPIELAQATFGGQDIQIDGSKALEGLEISHSAAEILLIDGFPNTLNDVEVSFDSRSGNRHKLYPGMVMRKPFKKFYVWTSGNFGASIVSAPSFTIRIGVGLASTILGSKISPIFVQEKPANLSLGDRETLGVAAFTSILSAYATDPMVKVKKLYISVEAGIVSLDDSIWLAASPGHVYGPFEVVNNAALIKNEDDLREAVYSWRAEGFYIS